MIGRGVVVWTGLTGEMIVWCAENAELAYLPDVAAICDTPYPIVGDTVSVSVAPHGPIFLVRSLSLEKTGAGQSLVQALGDLRVGQAARDLAGDMSEPTNLRRFPVGRGGAKVTR